MLEGVLGVLGDRRSPLPANEILALERTEQGFRIGSGQAAPRCDAAEPEDLPVHSGLSEQLLFGSGQGVQSRSDDTLNRLRQLAARTALRQHADVLLREQRVATRSLEQRLLLVRKLKRPLEHRREQAHRLVVAERLQRDRGRVCLPASPGLAPLQQLRPCCSDD